MKRYTLIAALVTTCVLFTGGCKDDHSGHDHDKPAVNSGDTDKNREVQP